MRVRSLEEDLITGGFHSAEHGGSHKDRGSQRKIKDLTF